MRTYNLSLRAKLKKYCIPRKLQFGVAGFGMGSKLLSRQRKQSADQNMGIRRLICVLLFAQACSWFDQ